jgi:hypothetical protein
MKEQCCNLVPLCSVHPLRATIRTRKGRLNNDMLQYDYDAKYILTSNYCWILA